MQAADSINVITRAVEVMDIDDPSATIYESPSVYSLKYKYSVTDVGVNFNYESLNKAIIEQLGTGFVNGGLSVNTYQKIKSGVVWGGASFKMEQLRNVQNCETSDFLKLAPYVMADTVGGSLTSQTYGFYGGFRINLPSNFDISAEARYRALIEYRQVDPRPRNIVSDLSAKIGFSYGITNTSRIAIHAQGEIYKQTNEVKFYSETGVPKVIHCTGIGTDYHRFAGSNTSAYYNGYSFGAGVSYKSTGNGFNAYVVYNYFAYTKILSSLNELPLLSMAEHSVRSGIYYSKVTTPVYWHLGAEADVCKREGTENIFGTPSDNIYPQIGSTQQYGLTYAKVYVMSKVGFKRAADEMYVLPKVGYIMLAESYNYPYKQQRSQSVYASLNAIYKRYIGKWAVRAEAYGTYCGVIYVGIDAHILRSINPKVALYLNAGYRATIYKECFGNTASVTVGARF